jgi:hypothetical protein
VSRTISATDGGMATATAHGINLDHSLPIVKVTGVTNGGRYARPGPTPHCTPSDALSGVASCTLTRYSTRHGDVTTVHYTGTAKDKAGNARATSGTFQLSSFAIQGATFSTGAYTVHRGHTYLFVVNSSTRPAYYDAAPFPATPFQPDPLAMRSAGYHRWSLPVMMTKSLRAHRYWNIGIKIGSTLHVLKIRVLASGSGQLGRGLHLLLERADGLQRIGVHDVGDRAQRSVRAVVTRGLAPARRADADLLAEQRGEDLGLLRAEAGQLGDALDEFAA